MSSNNLDKYEYLTGEDLGLKRSTIEQAKFEYSQLGKIFNKGLDKKEDKKEGLLKKLKNIEGKNEEQLEEIKNINIGSKQLKTINFVSIINEKAKKLMDNIKQRDDWFGSAQLICTKTDERTKSNYNNSTFPLKFISKISRRSLTLQGVKDDQQKFKKLINKLNNDYNPKNQTKIKEKDDALKSAKKIVFYKRRDYYCI